ncbi:hypothetical protein D9M70_508940 [compost metagenome]
MGACPFEARLADADAIAPCLAVAGHQIEKAVVRIDDDRARLFLALIGDRLRQVLRVEFRLDRPLGAHGVGRLDQRVDGAAFDLRLRDLSLIILFSGGCRNLLPVDDLPRAGLLPAELHYPGGGEVGADDHRRPVLIPILRHGGSGDEGQQGDC